MQTHDIAHLEARIVEMGEALSGLDGGSDVTELRRIIRQPWFTTPAEFALLLRAVEAVTAQARGLTELHHGLVAGARQVGAEKEAPVS